MNKLWSALHNTTPIRFTVDLGRLICTWLPVKGPNYSQTSPRRQQHRIMWTFQLVLGRLCMELVRSAFIGWTSVLAKIQKFDIFLVIYGFPRVKPDPDPDFQTRSQSSHWHNSRIRFPSFRGGGQMLRLRETFEASGCCDLWPWNISSGWSINSRLNCYNQKNMNDHSRKQTF